jgi:hypothetical protein
MKISTGTIIATVMAVVSSHAQVVEKKSLNLDGAKKTIAAAVDYAKKNDAPGGVIAVVDEGGNLTGVGTPRRNFRDGRDDLDRKSAHRSSFQEADAFL